jgi:hypothetical protein
LKNEIDKKKKDKGFMNFFKKKNYLALLLNQTQHVNFKTSQPNSFPNSGLKLTCMGDPVDLMGLKAT